MRRSHREKKFGGEFLAKGADTCVYSPPVACATRDPLPPGEHVSRIVLGTEEEDLQQEISDRVNELAPASQTAIREHINLATKACIPRLVETDVTNASGKSCSIHKELQTPGIKNNFTNLITPKQGQDLGATQKPNALLYPALRPLFRAILLLNVNDIVHGDAHPNNIAWVGDKLVLHDWGRATITPVNFFQNTLTVAQNEEEYRNYPQFKYPCELTDECFIGMPKEADIIFRIMFVWDTLALLGALKTKKWHDDRPIPQFKSVPETYTDEAIQAIKDLVKDESKEVNAASIQAIMDGYFQRLGLPPAPLTRQNGQRDLLPAIPRIVTPQDDSMGVSSSITSDRWGGARKKPKTQTRRFCKCIKAVKRRGRTERGAISICVHSILQSHGRTMKKFNCGRRARVFTQKAKRPV
jgi:hypothetical protein